MLESDMGSERQFQWTFPLPSIHPPPPKKKSLLDSGSKSKSFIRDIIKSYTNKYYIELNKGIPYVLYQISIDKGIYKWKKKKIVIFATKRPFIGKRWNL